MIPSTNITWSSHPVDRISQSSKVESETKGRTRRCWQQPPSCGVSALCLASLFSLSRTLAPGGCARAKSFAPTRMLFLKNSLAPLCCIFLSSCSIVPGISERTSAVSGRIVDATTSRPIADASISLHDAPKLRSTKSDANGRFLLRKTSNFHIISIYGICGPGGMAPVD